MTISAPVATGFQLDGQARWADMDPNSHMKNTAFLDYAADARMRFFQSHGFAPERFAQLQLGPIALKDTIEYRREIRLYESFTVTLTATMAKADGSRFTLVNTFTREDGSLAARVETQGAWFDQARRKITAPPPDLLALIQQLNESE